MYSIGKYFDFETSKVLLFISIPSGIFFFLPYSESIFFLFSAILLIGLKTNNRALILAGLFFSSLTRATAMFFIPAIIIMEISNSEKIIDKKAILNILHYSGIALFGLFCVVLFQYALTGEWFAFAKQQINFWQHWFSFPKFPLISFTGGRTLWLDGLAFLAGILATFLLILFLIKKLLNESNLILKNKAFWFSCGYLLMVTVYSLFFNPKHLDNQTSIDSINRYLFSTAYFMVFLLSLLSYFSFSLKYFILLFFISISTFVSLGFFGRPLFFFEHLEHRGVISALFFISMLVYVFLFFASSHKQYGTLFSYLLVLFNSFLTACFFYQFILAKWIA